MRVLLNLKIRSMSTATRILTDEMIAEIKAFFPRYPTKQAVTLPALHLVHDALRCVPRGFKGVACHCGRKWVVLFKRGGWCGGSGGAGGR